MISWINGIIINSWQENNKSFILINCQGIGYELQTLKSVIQDINDETNAQQEIVLWLRHIKKEDCDQLFGFISKDQRDFFNEILNIKGIGAQIGMALLSKYSLDQIINAIVENDKKLICSVQGVGQKMTDRLILELKSKLITKQIQNKNNANNKDLINNFELNSILQDLKITLHSLNYSQKEIKKVFPILIEKYKKNIQRKDEQQYISFENLLKEAMSYLDGKDGNIDL